jgi:hypothetical protein
MGCGESLQGRYVQPPEPDLEGGAGAGAGKDRQRVVAESRPANRRRSGQKE